MVRQRSPVIMRPSQRRQRSKWQREKDKQRALVIAGVIAVLFILAIPAYGYWANFIAPPRSVILQVDDAEYRLGFMARYIKGVQAMGGNIDMSVEPFRLMQNWQENELVISGADSRGISVDRVALDQELRDFIIGASSESTDGTPQEQLDREFQEKYQQYLDIANLTQEEHHKLVRSGMLREKLREALGEEIPSIARQARISWIVMPLRQSEGQEAAMQAQLDIQQVSKLLKAGEDFALLAQEYSDHRSSASKEGEYGWVPEGAFGTLDDIIFSLEPDEVSEVIESDEYAYFIKLHEIEEARIIEQNMKENMKESVLLEWLAEERGNHRINSCFGGGSAGGACDWQYDWLIKNMVASSPEQ